jgi:hypothetical protein
MRGAAAAFAVLGAWSLVAATAHAQRPAPATPAPESGARQRLRDGDVASGLIRRADGL